MDNEIKFKQIECMFVMGQIFPLLKSAGIAFVTVDYSFADSRQIDDILATGPMPESGPALEIPEAKVTLCVPSFQDTSVREKTLSIREAIEELCWMILEVYHAGPEHNDGGKGNFRFDIATEDFELKHSQFRAKSDSLTRAKKTVPHFQFTELESHGIVERTDTAAGFQFTELGEELLCNCTHPDYFAEAVRVAWDTSKCVRRASL